MSQPEFSEKEFARRDSRITAFWCHETPHKFDFDTFRDVIENCIGV